MKPSFQSERSLALEDFTLPSVDQIKSNVKSQATLKFVYKAQGTATQPWIAKLPFTGEALTVNSPVKPVKEMSFKAEMLSSDEFGEGLAVVLGGRK